METLETLLQDFVNACALQGKPIEKIWFSQAYPGIVSTSYIVNVEIK